MSARMFSGLLTVQEAAARAGIGRMALLDRTRLGELRTVRRDGKTYVDAVQFERWASANFGSGHLAAVRRQRRRELEDFKRDTTVTAAKARAGLYASKRTAPTSGKRSREAEIPPPRDLEAFKRWASITTAKARAGVHGPSRFARQSSRPASTAAQPTAAAIELAAARKAKLDQVRRRRLGWRADITPGTWSVEAGGQTFRGQFA